MQVSEFDVDDIPGAHGIRRSATAEDIEPAGTADEQPFDGYWVGFINGSSVYTVFLNGPPGSVSEEQASEDRERLLRTARRQLQEARISLRRRSFASSAHTG